MLKNCQWLSEPRFNEQVTVGKPVSSAETSQLPKTLSSFFRAEPGFVRQRSRSRKSLRLERLESRNLLTSWVEGFGGAGSEDLDDAQVMDAAGNIYLSGGFNSSPADFDPGPGVANLSTAGAGDAFAAKYDANGAFLWARRFGGTSGDSAKGSTFSAEATGNYLYVGGVFAGTADFGGAGNSLTSAGGYDIFVVKLDATNGSTIWAKRIGGKYNDWVADLIVTHDTSNYSDKLVLTGSFSKTVDFDPGPGTQLLTAAGKGSSTASDGYMLTLRTDATFVSAWRFGGTGVDSGGRLLSDGTTLYMTGNVEGTVDLDPGTGVLNVAGDFLAKFSGSTTPNWARSVNGTHLSSDSDALYVTGSVTTATGSNSDVSIARYDKVGGASVWSRQFGGAGTDIATTSAVDGNGLYVSGNFWSDSIDCDPSAPGGELINRGSATSDGLLVAFDSSTGQFREVWQIGGPGNERARLIGFQGTTLYVSGMFHSGASFPTGHTLTSAGNWDAFLMAFDLAGPQVTTAALTAASPLAAPTSTTQSTQFVPHENSLVLSEPEPTLGDSGRIINAASSEAALSSMLLGNIGKARVGATLSTSKSLRPEATDLALTAFIEEAF